MIHIKIILLISLAAFVACGGGSDELPKKDGKPISEEVFDEVEVDAALGRVLKKMKSILKDKEESQTLTQLQQPLSIDTNSQERNKRTHGVGSSGVGSSSSNQPYTRTVNVGGKTTYQERYHGYIGEINQHVDGKRLTVKGDTLYIDQKVVPGVNATERPLLIEWGDGVLKIGGMINTKFGPIHGTGSCTF